MSYYEVSKRGIMKSRSVPKLFTLFFYAHKLIDLGIAIIAFLFILIIVWISISNRQLADLGSLIFGLISLLYGVTNFIIKANNDLKESEALEVEALNIFENCRNIVLVHFPEAEELTNEVEGKILSTYLDDWKKHQNIKPFEYQLMDSYLNHIVTEFRLDDSDKLFLKYRMVSSTMTSYFPSLIGEIEHGDYFTKGTAHNVFIKKIHLLANDMDIKNASSCDVDDKTIQDTLNYALKKSNPDMEKLLNEKKSREKIQYLLNKCYENAYSNIGNLDRDLQDDSKRNLVLMFKYDERFTIPKRQWNTEIKRQLAKKYVKESELKSAYEIEVQNLKNMLKPQPFSHAIQDFGYCMERLAPNEYFLYAVYPEKFDTAAKGWSVEKFMKERVIPRAKQHLDEFNKKLIRKYPYLKKYQKKSVDANYYLFHFNRQHFEYFADQESIPIAIKRFLVKSILESENATDHLASQLVYVKQVIGNITLSGLLFTESLESQKGIQEKEGEILKKAKKNNLIMNNVHEIASLGNQVDPFIKIMYEVYYGKPLKRKQGKSYDFIKNTAKKIVENAREILQVFETLKTST
jgi:hypothetical protein